MSSIVSCNHSKLVIVENAYGEGEARHNMPQNIALKNIYCDQSHYKHS